MPAARLWPARKARATSSSASGSWRGELLQPRAPLVPQPQPNGSENSTSAVERREDTRHARPASVTVAPTSRQHQADAEQRARLDVAVGLLEHLLQADRNFGVSISSSDLLVVLERRLAQDVRPARRPRGVACRSACRAASAVLRRRRRGTRRPAGRSGRPRPRTTITEINKGTHGDVLSQLSVVDVSGRVACRLVSDHRIATHALDNWS